MFYDRTVLDSGITVISESIPTVRSVAIGIWTAAGSRDERPAEAGISHFLEHMMFKGTPTRSAQEISESFDRLGAEVNAFTSEEATCYYSRVIDTHAPEAFDVLADMVVNSVFDRDAAISEREVVLEEISRTEDTPDHKADDLFSRALWTGHPIGRPVLGERETVSGFLPEHLRSYTGRHYRTGDIVVAAAGNLPHAELVEMAEAALAGLPVGARADRELSTAIPGRHVAVATKETEQAHICWGTLSLSAKDPDRFAADLMNAVLGGSMASRLFQEIREKRGLAYAVHSYNSLYTDTGGFMVYAGTRPENTAEVVGLIETEVAKMLDTGLTASELDRARDSVDGHLVLGLENTNRRMMRLGGPEVGGRELLSVDEIIERYAAVTLDDILRVARVTLGGPKTLAVVGPHTTEEIEALLA
ncbi:MAG TPA: pitrilysin family protein [Coriobacteriia bacterium]